MESRGNEPTSTCAVRKVHTSVQKQTNTGVCPAVPDFGGARGGGDCEAGPSERIYDTSGNVERSFRGFERTINRHRFDVDKYTVYRFHWGDPFESDEESEQDGPKPVDPPEPPKEREERQEQEKLEKRSKAVVLYSELEHALSTVGGVADSHLPPAGRWIQCDSCGRWRKDAGDAFRMGYNVRWSCGDGGRRCDEACDWCRKSECACVDNPSYSGYFTHGYQLPPGFWVEIKFRRSESDEGPRVGKPWIKYWSRCAACGVTSPGMDRREKMEAWITAHKPHNNAWHTLDISTFDFKVDEATKVLYSDYTRAYNLGRIRTGCDLPFRAVDPTDTKLQDRLDYLSELLKNGGWETRRVRHVTPKRKSENKVQKSLEAPKKAKPAPQLLLAAVPPPPMLTPPPYMMENSARMMPHVGYQNDWRVAQFMGTVIGNQNNCPPQPTVVAVPGIPPGAVHGLNAQQHNGFPTRSFLDLFGMGFR